MSLQSRNSYVSAFMDGPYVTVGGRPLLYDYPALCATAHRVGLGRHSKTMASRSAASMSAHTTQCQPGWPIFCLAWTTT